MKWHPYGVMRNVNADPFYNFNRGLAKTAVEIR